MARVASVPLTADDKTLSPSIKLFTVDDGLVDSTVTGTAVDRDGQLILATQGGLSRINGKEFVGVPNPEGIENGLLYDVEASSRGLLAWMAGQKLWLLNRPYYQGKWTALTTEPVADAASVADEVFVIIGDDVVHLRTPEAKDEQNQGVFRAPGAQKLAVSSNWVVAISKTHAIAFRRTDRSLFRLTLPPDLVSIESSCLVGNRLFVGTNDGLLAADLDSGGPNPSAVWFGDPRHLRGGWVPSLAAGKDAKGDLVLYAASMRGVVRLSAIGALSAPPRSELWLAAPEQRVDKLLSLALFSDGVLVAGMEHGLAIMDERLLKNYPRMPGRPNGESSLGFAHDGALMVGHGNALFKWRDQVVEEFRLVGPAASDSVRVVKASTWQDRPGTFVGTNQGRAFWLNDSGKIEPFIAAGVLDAATGIYDMQLVGGVHYIATWRGLVQQAKFGTAQKDELLPLPAPSSAYSIQSVGDRLFVATNGEFVSMRDASGTWSRVGIEAGVRASVNSSMVHTADGLFVASVQGIGVVDPETLKPLGSFTESTTPALHNQLVYHLAASQDGAVYAATNKGLHRLRKKDGAWTIDHMNSDNGLLGSGMFMNAMAIDANGRLFVASGRGVSVFDPREEIRDLRQPSLIWEPHTINGARSELQTSLGYRENSLGFAYALPQLVRYKETEYRTELVGLDAEPTAWSHTNTREFTTLPDGDYELRVWARDHLGRVSEPLRHRFAIGKAPWKTWWALLSYAAAIVLTTVQATRWRIRRLEEAQRQLESKVAERTQQLSVANTQLIANADELKRKASELEEKNGELEESHRAANRIFNALAQAMEGKVLDGKYKLAERIGEGGFGVVFRAQRQDDGLDVAVKVFRPTQGNDSAAALQRFQLEAKSAAMIQHPHAITVFDSGVSDDGVAYMVMELLRGKSLQKELEDAGKLPPRRALQICVDVCDALARAHELKVIHRDIKPDNVFLAMQPDGSEIVKVLDFGVAKLTEPSKSMDIRSLTMSGAVVGTPAYLAPERLAGSEYDARSDVYAVGVMLYQLLVGRVPFESDGSNVFSIVMKHLNEPPPMLTTFDPSISADLQALVLAALEKKPDNRPTALGFKDLILKYFARQAAQTSDSIQVRAPSPESAT